MSLIAFTRAVSPDIGECELTHLNREGINPALAQIQHQAYEGALESVGCRVQRLPCGSGMPDSVFIEDTAVVLDEAAVIMRPGAVSRRVEVPAVEVVLAPFRRILRIEPPGTVDGGDVLVTGKSIFVGLSTRTNEAAVDQMGGLLSAFGYHVTAVRVSGCLHLKSAVTALADGVLLMNRDWAPAEVFKGFDIVDVDPADEYGANVLRVGDRLLYPTAFPATLKRLRDRGFDVTTVDVSELAKAEGAVTCCSLIVRA